MDVHVSTHGDEGKVSLWPRNHNKSKVLQLFCFLMLFREIKTQGWTRRPELNKSNKHPLKKRLFPHLLLMRNKDRAMEPAWISALEPAFVVHIHAGSTQTHHHGPPMSTSSQNACLLSGTPPLTEASFPLLIVVRLLVSPLKTIWI